MTPCSASLQRERLPDEKPREGKQIVQDAPKPLSPLVLSAVNTAADPYIRTSVRPSSIE